MTAATWVLVVANVLLVLVTLAYVVLTGKMLREQKRANERHFRPSVVVLLEPNRTCRALQEFVVRNTGTCPAYNVRFSIKPDHILSIGYRKPMKELPLFSEPLPAMAQGYEARHQLFFVEDAEDAEGNLPVVTLGVTYESAGGEEFQQEYSYALAHQYKNMGVIAEPTLADVYKKLNELIECLKGR